MVPHDLKSVREKSRKHRREGKGGRGGSSVRQAVQVGAASSTQRGDESRPAGEEICHSRPTSLVIAVGLFFLLYFFFLSPPTLPPCEEENLVWTRNFFGSVVVGAFGARREAARWGSAGAQTDVEGQNMTTDKLTCGVATSHPWPLLPGGECEAAQLI